MLFQRAISLINLAIKRLIVEVEVEYSLRVHHVLAILIRNSLIRGFQVTPSKRRVRVFLKFFEGRPVLKQLVRISRPGRKAFTSVASLVFFLNRRQLNWKTEKPQAHFYILSTSKGIMEHFEALRLNIAGIAVCGVEV